METLKFKCDCGEPTLEVDVHQEPEGTRVTYNCDSCEYSNEYSFGEME